jgi:hypothetical protein
MDTGVLFVVQVWRDARGFHAAARDVRHEEATRFDDPIALARFLAADQGSAADAAAPPVARTRTGG